MSYLLVFKRYAPFESFGGGFHGRGDSRPSYPDVARTWAGVPFDRSGVTGAGVGAASPTTHRTTRSSEYISNVRVTVTNARLDDGLVLFTAHSAGSNPHPIAVGAPDIDTYIDACIHFNGNGLTVSGVVRGNDFPNLEVFLKTPTDRIHLLHHWETSHGGLSGPFRRLWGRKEKQVITRFSTDVPGGS